MSKRRDDSYQLHPDTTRYIATDRYESPKEDFKFIAAKMVEVIDTKKRLKLVDVGCGNGEFIYFMKNQYPHWDFYGFDYTKEFIDTARSFAGLEGVHFDTKEYNDIEGTYDLVVTSCFLSLFQDVTEPLGKLVCLCEKGGYIFATGLFNPYDIEVRVEFCDNSNPETSGIWRTDFNRHSQQSIRKFLADKVENVNFHECEYNIEILQDMDKPIRVWTMKNTEGDTFLINGAYQLANQTLMIIRK